MSVPIADLSARPLLVFDGDCGFCTQTVTSLQRWIKRHPNVQPWQVLDLDSIGLTAEQCTTAVQWVGVDGEIRSAERAVARTLIDGGKGWMLVGRIIDLPGIRWIGGFVYRWVARNRTRLPGGTPACSIAAHQKADPPRS